jgi:hypothetical protein
MAVPTRRRSACFCRSLGIDKCSTSNLCDRMRYSPSQSMPLTERNMSSQGSASRRSSCSFAAAPHNSLGSTIDVVGDQERLHHEATAESWRGRYGDRARCAGVRRQARVQRTTARPCPSRIFTGMRLSEVLALRWRYVDLDKAVIQVRAALEPTKAHGIRFKAPKSKAGRRDITLPDILVAALREYRKAQLELRMKLGAGRLPDDALLFGDINGNPVPPNVISAAWSDFAASKRVGMPELTFHALRHTHASQLIDANVDIVTISKRLGHAKPDITLRITLTCSARMTARPRPRSMRFWVRRVPIGCQYSIFVLIGGSAKALKPLRRKGGRAV